MMAWAGTCRAFPGGCVGLPRSPSPVQAPTRLESSSAKPHVAQDPAGWGTDSTAERESPLLSPPLFHVSADAIAVNGVCLSGGKKQGPNQMAGLINCSGKAS